MEFIYSTEELEFIKTEGPFCKNFKKSLENKNIKFTISQWLIFKMFRNSDGKKFDSASKEFFIAKYGEEHGEKFYNERLNKTSQSLNGFIFRYGKEEGLIRWQKFREKASYYGSRQYFIDKFGKDQGEMKWKERNKKCSVTKEKYIESHGEDAWIKLTESRKHTEQSFISRYGEIEGPVRWENYKVSNPLYGKNTKPNQVAYWLNLGYTEEEAKGFVKSRQQTFTYEKCIEKFGIEEGTRKWKERQIKWQNTLQNKTSEEITEINRKRGLNKHGIPHKGGISSIENIKERFPNTGGYLYYIKFYYKDCVFWKIGITSNPHGVHARLGKKFFVEYSATIEFEIFFENYSDAFIIEQQILNEFQKNRIYYVFLSTEIFNKNILEGVTENEIKNRIC